MAIDFYETVEGCQFIHSTMNSLRSLPDIAEELHGIRSDLDKLSGIESERHQMEKEKMLDDIKAPDPEDILKGSSEDKEDDAFVWVLVRTDDTASDFNAEAFRDLKKAQEAMVNDVCRRASSDISDEKKKCVLSLGYWDDDFFGKNDGIEIFPLKANRYKNDKTMCMWKIVQVEIA